MKKKLSFKKISLKKISWKKALMFVPLLVVISIGTYTLAKYVIEEFHSYFLSAKDFYFTSNRLKKSTATYMVNNWSGVGSFDISFDLLSIKNSYVYSDFDIPYTVSKVCPNDVTCTFDKVSGTVYKDGHDHADTVVLTVVPSRSYAENEQLTIYIEATSVSPYKETLSANFVYVVGKQGITYEVEDEVGRPYMMFKITNAINYCTVIEAFGDWDVDDEIEASIYRTLDPVDKAKCVGEDVTISFDPNTILLDTTSNITNTATYTTTTIGGVAYVNSLSFMLEPSSTVAIKYYKVTPASNYTYTGDANQTCIVNVTFP